MDDTEQRFIEAMQTGKGDKRFLEVLLRLWNLHCTKSSDYGAEKDPLANIRSGVEFGVPNWVGTMIRANDKMFRIKAFASKGNLANESVEDSLIDLAAYPILALILLEEDKSDSARQES